MLCPWEVFIYTIFGRLMYGYWTGRLYTNVHKAFIKKPKPNPRFFMKPAETDRLQDFENRNNTTERWTLQSKGQQDQEMTRLTQLNMI